MHNWRLLLLALVAVLQPIASFTERNLIDGQQCCDHQPHSLRETRPSLHGTYRFSKPSSEEGRVAHREIRKDRRYESRQQNSILTRPLTERSLLERVRSVSADQPARFLRAERRFTRIIEERGRVLQARERNVRDIRVIRRDDYRRVVNERLQKDDRDTAESARSRVSQVDSRTVRLGTERSSRVPIDARRDKRQIENSGRISITRNRDTFTDGRSGDYSMTSNRRNLDELRVRTVKRRLSGIETRPQLEDYRERRSVERHTRQIVSNDRRALSADARIDVRNVRRDIRNSQQDPEYSQRVRMATERLDERRQHRDVDRASRDRTISIRRDTRERMARDRRLETRDSASRSANVRSAAARNVITERNDERHSRVREDIRTGQVEFRRNMERNHDHRNTVLDGNSRAAIRMYIRDIRPEVRVTRSAEGILAGDVSRTRDLRARESNKFKNTESRFTNIESIRSRQNLDSVVENKAMHEDQTFDMNWQFVFYTLQGIYLCGILVQMLTENKSAKRKSRNNMWWASFSPNHIKMD